MNEERKRDNIGFYIYNSSNNSHFIDNNLFVI